MRSTLSNFWKEIREIFPNIYAVIFVDTGAN